MKFRNIAYRWRLGLIFVVAQITGCATTNDIQQTRSEGAAAGAFIGGVVGQILGGDRKATVIGAAVGGAIGLAFGNHVANKKASFASQEEYLQAVIDEANKVGADAKSHNEKLADSIEELKLRRATMEANAQHLTARNQDVKSEKIAVQGLVHQSQNMLTRLNREIEIQRKVVIAEKISSRPELIQTAALGYNKLEVERRSLAIALAQLEVISDERAY